MDVREDELIDQNGELAMVQLLGNPALAASLDNLICQLCRARKHDLVTAVHFKQSEDPETRRHSRMKMAWWQRLVLAAVDEALGHAQ